MKSLKSILLSVIFTLTVMILMFSWLNNCVLPELMKPIDMENESIFMIEEAETKSSWIDQLMSGEF